MKKSGSPTKPYMCNSDNPKMNSSNMGKGQGKGYYDGGLVPLNTGGFVPLPPTGRFIGTPNAPMPPVRPKPPAMSQPFGPTLNSPPAGRFAPPPMGSSMRGAAPMQGMAPMTPNMGSIPMFGAAPMTPTQKVLEQAKRRKSTGI
jgi:hypothetical protein